MIEKGRFLELTHPEYGIVFYEVVDNNLPCPCGQNDSHQLEVAVDNDSSLKDGVYYPSNARSGMRMKVCGQELMKELRSSKNNFRLQPKKYDQVRRELIIKG